MSTINIIFVIIVIIVIIIIIIIIIVIIIIIFMYYIYLCLKIKKNITITIIIIIVVVIMIMIIIVIVIILILKQLYRKTVTRPPDIYNVNFKFTNKIQVEKLLHNCFLKICDIWSTTTINSGNIHPSQGVKFPGVVAVLSVVPSGLVLHIGITSCTFPPWTEMSKKNRYERYESRWKNVQVKPLFKRIDEVYVS